MLEVNFIYFFILFFFFQSVRRKRKRDVLRAYLVRIFELNAEHGCFSDRSGFYALRLNFNINARVLYFTFVFVKAYLV